MASVSIPEVRKICKLLKSSDISDSDLQDFIYDADSYIYLCIGGDYSLPPRPKVNPAGTIAVVQSSVNITGTGTYFKFAGILPGQHLFIVDTNEIVVVDKVISETLLTAKSFSFNMQGVTDPVIYDPINITSSLSQFYIIPDDICTASKYLAGKLALMAHFSEAAYKQDTKAFYEYYQRFVDKIITKMEDGGYYNSLLVAQTSDNNAGRLIKINIESYRAVFDNRLSRLNTNTGKNL